MINLDFIETLPFIKKMPLNPKEKRLVGFIFLISFAAMFITSMSVVFWRITEPKDKEIVSDTTLPKTEGNIPITTYDSIETKAFLVAARSFEKSGDLYNAALYLEKISISSPKNYEIKIELAQLMIKMGEVNKCNDLAKELRKIYPNNSSVANIYLNTLPIDKIKPTLETELSNFRNDPSVLSEAGRILFMSDTSEALKCLNMALSLDSNNANALYLFGHFYNDKNEPNKATIYLEKAVAISPLDATYRTDLATSYHKLKKFDKAMAQYKSAIKLDPDNFTAHFSLGDLYYNILNLDIDGAYEFEKALRIDSTSWEAAFNLGMIYLSKKKRIGAIKYLELASKNAPRNIRVLHQLAIAYEKNNELDRALEQYDKILSINPLDDIALYKKSFIKNRKKS